MKGKKMLGKKRNLSKLEIPLNENNALIKLESIKKYKNRKIEEWNEKKNNKDFDLKNFIINEYDILNEGHSKYLNNLLSINDDNEFIKHYSKYQFVLKLETRKQFQEKFEKNKKIMDSIIIKFNLIPNKYDSIKDILINVVSQIVELRKYANNRETMQIENRFQGEINNNNKNEENTKLNDNKGDEKEKEAQIEDKFQLENKSNDKNEINKNLKDNKADDKKILDNNNDKEEKYDKNEINKNLNDKQAEGEEIEKKKEDNVKKAENKYDNKNRDNKDILYNEKIDEIIINIFKSNRIYFNANFNYLIPTKFSDSYAYKYNKLLFDIANFFFPYPDVLEEKNINEDIRTEIKEKLCLFAMIKFIIDKIDKIHNDDELIELFDYIFNCLEIMIQVDKFKKKNEIFARIINSCLPFELDIAKERIKYYQNSCLYNIFIDGKDIYLFNSNDLKENSEVQIITKHKAFIAPACDICWYNLDLLTSDIFMLCFRYRACKINNYLMDKPIKDNFLGLFNKMIKSKIIKSAMMKDSEAASFDYPFSNDDILNECIESIHYVPFPAEGIYGFTDKNSFNIYIYSNFNADSLKLIITEYDNILKTQSHEFKHITRIYYHIFNPKITLKTPTINNSSKLISANLEYMKEKISNINSSYSKRTLQNFNLKEYDYGDIFEIFLTGSKSSNFFLANSYFCLLESTWSKTVEDFDKEYRNSIEERDVLIIKNVKNYPFITSIMEYFSLQSNLKYPNDLITKGASKENDQISSEDCRYSNVYTYKETISHVKFTK